MALWRWWTRRGCNNESVDWRLWMPGETVRTSLVCWWWGTGQSGDEGPHCQLRSVVGAGACSRSRGLSCSGFTSGCGWWRTTVVVGVGWLLAALPPGLKACLRSKLQQPGRSCSGYSQGTSRGLAERSQLLRGLVEPGANDAEWMG